MCSGFWAPQRIRCSLFFSRHRHFFSKCGVLVAFVTFNNLLEADLKRLREERVAKGSDWVSQLSSTGLEAETLDCQLLYSCQECHLLPARAASWYLLESPNKSRKWACARCGQTWGGPKNQRILVVKVNRGTEAVLCEIPSKFTQQNIRTKIRIPFPESFVKGSF